MVDSDATERERVRRTVTELPSSKSVEWIADRANVDEETAREECERLVKRLIARRVGDERYDVRLWVLYYQGFLRRLGLRK